MQEKNHERSDKTDFGLKFRFCKAFVNRKIAIESRTAENFVSILDICG